MRFLKILFLLFVFLFNYVSTQKCSQFSLNLVSESCSTPSSPFIGNKITINGFQLFSNFTIQPMIPLHFGGDGGVYFSGAKLNQNYVVTAYPLKSGCLMVSQNITVNSGLNYEVKQAPCLYSQGSITFYTDKAYYGFQMDPTSQVLYGLVVNGSITIPIYTGIYNHSIIHIDNEDTPIGNSNCLIPFSITSSSHNNTPKIKPIVGNCATGEKSSIFISNYLDFTSLSLLQPSTPAISGIISDLDNGTYTIVAESLECGRQQGFTFSVESKGPSIEFIFNPSCPANIQVTAGLKEGDESQGVWSYSTPFDSTPITFPYTLDRNYSSHIITWDSLNGCTSSREFTIPPYKLPIRHEIQSQVLSCNDSTIIVKLIQLFDASLQLMVYDATSGEMVVLNSDLTFSIPYEHEIEIKSLDDCYSLSEKYEIYVPLPKPVLNIIGDEYGYGFETVDIIVPNYLDFSELYMTNITQVQPLQSLQSLQAPTQPSTNRIYHVDGVFKSVPRSYSLVYQFRNCSEPVTLNLNLVPIRIDEFRSPNIYLKYNITETPTCDAQLSGWVVLDFYHTEFGYLGQGTFSFGVNNETLQDVRIYYGNYLIFTDWVVPSTIEYIQPNTTIMGSLIQTCPLSYLNYQVSTNSEINSLFINNIQYPFINDSIYKFPLSYNLTVTYTHDKCKTFTEINVLTPTTDFTLQYEITPLLSCNAEIGYFNITSTELTGLVTFSKYPQGDVVYNYTSSNIPTSNELAGGKYQLTYQTGSCDTQTMIFEIPNPTNIQPTHKVIKSPSCISSDIRYSDSIVAFYLKQQDNTLIEVDSIYNPVTDSYTNYYSSEFQPGLNTVYLTYNNCRYRYDFNLQMIEPEITYRQLDIYSCYDGGYSLQLQTDISDIIISGIETQFPCTFYKDGSYVKDFWLNEGSILVQWNNGYCSKSIDFKLTKEEEPSFIYYVQDCGSYNGYIEVTQPDRYVICSSFGCSDSLGRLYNSMNFYQEDLNIEIYDGWSGCDNEGNLPLNRTFMIDLKATNVFLQSQNESCSGSNDGTLSFVNYYPISFYLFGRIEEDTYSNIPGKLTSFYAASSPSYPNSYNTSLSREFINLTPDAYYYLLLSSPQNALCQAISLNEFQIYRNEPQFKIDSTQICNQLETNVTLDRIDNSTLSLSINNITSQNGTFNNLQVGQSYDMKFTLMADTCRRSITTTLLIPEPNITQSCSTKRESKRSNLGLQAGLVVGLLSGAVLLILISLYVFDKKSKITKVIKKRRNTIIPMSTVSIFQGGKVQAIDKF